MRNPSRISTAFEPFLAECGPNDHVKAIVIYRHPDHEPQQVKTRGRLRKLKRKLDAVKAQAAAQDRLMKSYHREAGKSFAAKPIAEKGLPVMTIEVSRKTLPALAASPEVVAVMPNQRVHLLKPKSTNLDPPSKQEARWGMTWGLKRLEIPKLWAATKGRDIKVGVLDTGVYGDHEAFDNRVSDFIVIDPLGRDIRTRPSFDAGNHGTHVCGTIAGGEVATPKKMHIGVAPEATLAVAAVLLEGATLESVLRGMNWAVERDVDLISMSLGFTYYEPEFRAAFDMLLGEYGVPSPKTGVARWESFLRMRDLRVP